MKLSSLPMTVQKMLLLHEAAHRLGHTPDQIFVCFAKNSAKVVVRDPSHLLDWVIDAGPMFPGDPKAVWSEAISIWREAPDSEKDVLWDAWANTSELFDLAVSHGVWKAGDRQFTPRAQA